MSTMSDVDFVRLLQRTFGLTEDGWPGAAGASSAELCSGQ